jgi:Na+/proline symporter
MLFGRLLSAESAKAARKGALWAIAGLCCASVLIVLIGLLSQGLIPGDTPADQVLTGVVRASLPAWMAYVMHLTLLGTTITLQIICHY